MVNKNKISLPRDAVVAVTYRCNSRCVMCNIWQIEDFPELPPEAYRKLPRSLRDINISGGEPFLRDDLVEIVKIIKETCPYSKINISTNGFLTKRIQDILPELLKIDKNLSISVSVDGIGQLHEKIRRVPDAWPKVLETLNFCRRKLKKGMVKMAFTLNELNYQQLATAYEWSQRLGVDFTMAVAHTSQIYFSAENEVAKFSLDREVLREQFDFVIKGLLKSMNPKDWVRSYFVDGLYKISIGEKRPLASYAGEDFFYLDPKGDVYPSVIDNIIMGNINDFKYFTDLWESDAAERARRDVRGFESNYWMVCTARTAILRNPLKVANWIFKKKIKWKY